MEGAWKQRNAVLPIYLQHLKTLQKNLSTAVVNLSAAASRTFGGTAADLRKRRITGCLVTLSQAAR